MKQNLNHSSVSPFSLFIAHRYLFSKKKTHAINIISLISIIGVAVATTALVIVLSVFNGFHDLVASFFTNFDPQLKVMPVSGKTAPADDPILTQIRQLPQVEVATETVEDMALAVYNGRQAMVTVKGVDDNFADLTHSSSCTRPTCNTERLGCVWPKRWAPARSGKAICTSMRRSARDSSISPTPRVASSPTRSSPREWSSP